MKKKAKKSHAQRMVKLGKRVEKIFVKDGAMRGLILEKEWPGGVDLCPTTMPAKIQALDPQVGDRVLGVDRKREDADRIDGLQGVVVGVRQEEGFDLLDVRWEGLTDGWSDDKGPGDHWYVYPQDCKVIERAPQYIPSLRTFDTGATRDTDSGKHDPEGYLSPLVERRFCEYMTKHRVQSDGALRASDNWQKGIPKDEYVKSLLRHVQDVRLEHDGYESREGMEDALCGIIFNAQGYLFELLVSQEMRRPWAGTPDFS